MNYFQLITNFQVLLIVILASSHYNNYVALFVSLVLMVRELVNNKTVKIDISK